MKAIGVFSIISAVLAFLTQVIIARNSELTTFGAFVAIQTFILMLVPLASFGFFQISSKLFHSYAQRKENYCFVSLSSSVFSCVVCFTTVVLWSVLGAGSSGDSLLFFGLSFLLISQMANDVASAIYHIREDYTKLALLHIIPNLSRFLIAATVCYFRSEISYKEIFYIYFVSSLITAMLSFLVIFSAEKIWVVTTNVNVFLSDLKVVQNDILSIGLSGFIYTIYFQCSFVFCRYILGDEASGAFGVAFTLITAVYVLPSVLYQKFYNAKIVELSVNNYQEYIRFCKISNLKMLIVGLFACFFLITFSWFYVPLLFGDKFTESVSYINIILMSVPIRFLATSFGAALNVQKFSIMKIKMMTTVAVLSLILTPFLIVRFGITGAALSMVLCDFALLILYIIGFYRYVSIPSTNIKCN